MRLCGVLLRTLSNLASSNLLCFRFHATCSDITYYLLCGGCYCGGLLLPLSPRLPLVVEGLLVDCCIWNSLLPVQHRLLSYRSEHAVFCFREFEPRDAQDVFCAPPPPIVALTRFARKAVYYFSYMAIGSLLFGLMTGAIGVIASFAFIATIYRLVKAD